uniref:DAGKc domain-containing protein n=1 Tax=Zooxanthella nutricula TaxID=1333877 RepID=A0A7S2PX87_9DINO
MTKAQVVGRPVKMDSLDAYGFVGGEESEEAPRITRQFTDAEAAILRCAKRHWTMRQEENDRARRASELQELLAQTREQLLVEPTTNWMPANRYGNAALLPAFEPGKHVPVLALINPYSGAMAGTDILSIARKSPYYQQRFFNIIDVVKDQRRGGLLDLFRIELNAAKDEAKAMGTRPRIISGGGDGTASFSLFMVFAALRADASRGDDIVEDTGNGFIWTDEEMRDSFPALAQMPLGSANDFGHTLGWGHKYPGDFEGTGCVGSRHKALNALQVWIEAVINPSTRLANFDLFGFCPAEGQDSYNFRLAELTGRRGMNPKVLADGKQHLLMKEAGTPVPLFCCLYFSAGFAAYMTARFQINRRSKPLHNKLEYARQAIGIVSEQVPPQLQNGLEGIEINCGGSRYFPPREDDDEHAGSRYREVGFLNINWQAGMAHGADRAPACTRLCAIREPAKFNDGMVDMYRLKFSSAFKNPGLHIQTDKKEHGMTLSFKGGLGKGVFFQWDGEARFAFSPTGEPFDINVRKILNVPVVLGPEYNAKVTGDPDNGHAVHFAFVAKTLEQQQAVRERILRGVRNELNRELNATREEMLKVGLQCEELPRAHQHHPSQ